MAIYRGPGGAPSATDSITLNQIIQLELDAEDSAAAAAASESAAASSASAAQTAETNAETAETNAEAAQSAAETAQTGAETAESNAQTSETNAAASAVSAAASLDSFDDRYLGAKSSDPTTDNDGDALITGALYFNTTVQEMRVYNSSAWIPAANLEVATETIAGKVEKATTAEAVAGSSNKWPDAAGVLSHVQQYGLGGTMDATTPLTSTDLDTVVDTGFYRSISGNTNVPSGANQAALVEVYRTSSATNVQVYTDFTPRRWVRADNGVSWTDWEEVLTEANVTISAIDTTAGRLTKVSDFGLGVPNTEFENILNETSGLLNGFFRATSGGPVPATSYFGFQSSNSTSFATRFYGRDDTYFVETVESGVRSPIRELYHTGNILGTVSESAGVPTGAIIERGSNANGEYVKYADGTLICNAQTTIDNTTALGSLFRGVTAVTFPATFTAAPDAAPATQDGTAQTWSGIATSISTTGISLRSVGVASLTGIPISYIAFGRWF